MAREANGQGGEWPGSGVIRGRKWPESGVVKKDDDQPSRNTAGKGTTLRGGVGLAARSSRLSVYCEHVTGAWSSMLSTYK